MRVYDVDDGFMLTSLDWVRMYRKCIVSNVQIANAGVWAGRGGTVDIGDDSAIDSKSVRIIETRPSPMVTERFKITIE